MSIAGLLAGYRDGSTDPGEVIERAYERARTTDQPAWISLVAWPRLRAWAAELRTRSPDLPLYGIPFAVKDNIDLAGAATTAACPAYAYTPDRSAFVVARLVAAGAIPIGKTNMDQFATGLTGTRTPHGACASVVDGRYVSGGSSSGSAVAVADGTVALALGTDTAGSGRVPAALNAIVGLKASPGLLSTGGVVPACRSIDCVTLLTADVAGAALAFSVAARYDPDDPYSRAVATTAPAPHVAASIGVPRPEQLSFCGDRGAQRAWERALARAEALGWRTVEIDFEPFAEAAALLYGGPWVAERHAAVGDFVASHPADVDPVVRRIVMAARDVSAVDAFRGAHRLAELRRATLAAWAVADALMVPSTPTVFTHAEIAEQPIERNAQLGTYTNFVNLLGLCAIAVPGGAREDGLPFGISLIAPGGRDELALALAGRWCGERVEGGARP